MKIFLIIISFFAFLLLTGCQTSWHQPVPTAEVTYQMNLTADGSYELDFVQADGTNRRTINLDENFIMPSWSSDGKILFGLSTPVGQPPYEDIGYPAYWDVQNKVFQRCDSDLPYFKRIQSSGNPQNRYEVLLTDSYQILLYDLSSCKKLQVIVDNGREKRFFFSGLSLNHGTQEMLYGRVIGEGPGRQYQVVKRGLVSGDEVVLAEGINPVWSPAGTQIAYLNWNGIYVLQVNGTEPRQLTFHRFFEPFDYGSSYTDGPIPRWSPDGEWLVYHQCADSRCLADQTQLLKIRVSDSVQKEIQVGGKFPTWYPLTQK